MCNPSARTSTIARHLTKGAGNACVRGRGSSSSQQLGINVAAAIQDCVAHCRSYDVGPREFVY